VSVITPLEEAPLEAELGFEEAGATAKGVFRRSLAYRRTQVGLVIVVALVLVAILGPAFAPHSPTGFIGAPFKASAPGAPLGTDYLGRDVLSRFLDGGHSILLLAVLGTLLGVGAGTLVGMVSAYSGRVVDESLMRVMDLLLAFPALVLALLLITALGSHPWLLVVAVGISFMPNSARVIRAAASAVVESDFVRYAHATGVSGRRILFQEILPNVAGPLAVEAGLRLTYSIGMIAGLDYLGLGIQPPAADWGLMIQENQSGITSAPLAVLVPIIAVALLTVGANLVTDGVAHAAAGRDRSGDE
jgi:peptide/nickel transport system permease protein